MSLSCPFFLPRPLVSSSPFPCPPLSWHWFIHSSHKCLLSTYCVLHLLGLPWEFKGGIRQNEEGGQGGRREIHLKEGSEGRQLMEVAFWYQPWNGKVGAGRKRVLFQKERRVFENAPRSGAPRGAPGRERTQCGQSILSRGGRGTKTSERHRIFWPGHLDP